MDILASRTLYMSCQAGPGIEPGPSALKASALPIELTWQTHLSKLIAPSTSIIIHYFYEHFDFYILLLWMWQLLIFGSTNIIVNYWVKSMSIIIHTYVN